MNNRRNDRGNLDFDSKRSYYSSYVTSAVADERKESFLKLLIVASVLLLAVIAIIFFANSNDSIPAFIQQTTNGQSANNDPSQDLHPYATVPTKQNYLAEGNGTGFGGLPLNSDYAVLVDLSTMEVVASKKADTQIYPASMTKIMTVLVACDLISDLDDTYVIQKSVLYQVPGGAATAFSADYIGSTVTLRDILFGITYRSGADAVLCLLDYLNISLSDFVALMNEKAQSLGLTKTHFGGLIGMDDENNQTTCREMAAIMAYAMDNPLCRELFGCKNYSSNHTSGLVFRNRTVENIESMSKAHNSLVDGYAFLATKSGYETKAQHCLVSYIQNKETGKYFVLVTAKSTNKTDPLYDLIKIFEKLKP